MGTWAIDAFGNDDAADWVYDLLEAEFPVAFLRSTLELASQPEYLDAPDGSQILAAAAVIAASGEDPYPVPDNVSDWISGKEEELRALAPQARVAVERVKSDPSELKELWEETEDFAPWLADLDLIVAGLNAVGPGAGPPGPSRPDAPEAD